jgi:hypothetical protein
MASLYSIKPNPFISLISVISPVPWVLKWFSTSALVATVHGVQSANSEEVSECRPSSPGSSSEVMDQCQGDWVQANAGLRATGQSQTETRRRCAEMGGEGIARSEASHIHVHDSWACSASVSCSARWLPMQGRWKSESHIGRAHRSVPLRGRLPR